MGFAGDLFASIVLPDLLEVTQVANGATGKNMEAKISAAKTP